MATKYPCPGMVLSLYMSISRKHRPILAKTNVAHKDDPVFLGVEGRTASVMAAFEALFKRLKKRTGIDGKRVSPS